MHEPRPWTYSGVTIDGYTFDQVSGSHNGSGNYTLRTRGECVTTEDLKSKINWEQPTIENLSETQACQLPQNFGYIMDAADYNVQRDEWTIRIHTLRRYFADCEQLDKTIAALNTSIAEKDAEITTKNQTIQTQANTITNKDSQIESQQSTIDAQTAEINDLNVALAEADELAIALYEAQQATEEPAAGEA